jgi:peroxin-11B
MEETGNGNALAATFTDTPIQLDALGARKSTATARLQREAYKSWLIGLSFNTFAGLYTLYNLRQRSLTLNNNKQDAEKAVEAKKVEREWNAAIVQLTSDLCDITVPMTALGYYVFDDGIVGLAGTVSSLLGIYTVWKKTA